VIAIPNPIPNPNPIANRNPNVTVSLTLRQPLAKPDRRMCKEVFSYRT